MATKMATGTATQRRSEEYAATQIHRHQTGYVIGDDCCDVGAPADVRVVAARSFGG